MPGGAPKGNKNHFRHGLSHTRIDNIYKGMLSRCYHPTNIRYKNYGGRGIKICDEWLNNKERFFEWAFSNGYEPSLSIDRVDVNGNYTPQNCRWATSKEQSLNRQNTKRYELDGRCLTLSEWSKITGIKKATLWARINIYGWNIERALHDSH